MTIRPKQIEAAKQQMKVRYNEVEKVWQVYTYLSGADMEIWKWFSVSKETAGWYRDILGAKVEIYGPETAA